MSSLGSPSTFFLAKKKAYEVERSLRFNDNDQAYLGRTPSSASNRKTWTISFWFKRGHIAVGDSNKIANLFCSAGNNDATFFDARIRNSDKLMIGINSQILIQTNQVFRDSNAWYHMVVSFDTTQASASNRLKLYINGSEVTSFEIDVRSSYVTQDGDFGINSTTELVFGKHGGNYNYFDGYMAEINLIDGSQLTPASFGETNVLTGQWNPKKYVGGYGTNGFYLPLSDNSGTTATTLGKDSSGNGNNFTPNNFTVSDVVPDTPTNNFCTGNFVGRTYTNETGNSPTYSEGNLEFETAGNPTHAYGTIAVNHFLTSGCYFEILLNDIDTARCYFGIVEPQSSGNSASYGFVDKAIFHRSGYIYNSTGIDGTSDYSSGVSITNGDIVGVAVKGTSVWFHKNGTYINNSSGSTGNPSTGANAAITAVTDIVTKHYLPYAGYNSDWTFNFGQDSTFAGEKTAQGNTDAGGIGDFYYPVPTGFKAMCTKNMPDPTIKLPNKHFDSLLWSGNSTNNRAITGLEFQPDFVWIKARTVSIMSHYLVYSLAPYTDSGTGNGNVGAFVSGTNATDAEGTTTDGGFESFDSNGYTFGKGNNDANADSAYQRMNASGRTYVGWNWNAGNTDGKTYAVTVVSDSGNKYRFDGFGTSAVTLDLAEGGTYIFDQSDSSNAGHPLRFYTAADKTGGEYTTGVTTAGTAGSSGAYTQIVVAASAPTLFYQCSAHAGMGGQANTNSTLGSSNFDGSIQSTVKANASAGFSLVSYTGTGADGTVGHGLGVTPDAIILKNRDRSVDWVVKHKSLTSGYILYLNLLGLPDGATGGNNGIIADLSSSSNFSITRTSNSGNYNLVGVNGEKYIAYCFSSVEGYSKFGKYIGNSNADGAFVYTGFRPAWLMIKRSSGGSDVWLIHDNTRDPDNVVQDNIFANSSDAEFDTDSVDFLSNGFKWRINSGLRNNAGNNYIYFAFAEAPFKNARAV